jgi:hypothetical protein
MSDCKSIQELLVLYSENELDSAQRAAVDRHLPGCPGCREELESIGHVRELLDDPELFGPKPDYAWQMLPSSLAARVKDAPAAGQVFPVRQSSLAWSLAMAATFVLSVGLVWLSHLKTPAPQPVAVHDVAAPGNDAFLKRIQTAYAREETSRYLVECQDLLLNVVRAEQNCMGDRYDVSLEVERARELLRRKRLLDRELDAPEVARARDLCNDLESFLVHLSTAQQCETSIGLQHMESFIERQQLLLRINVLQSELS